jgi:hypothetical protein
VALTTRPWPTSIPDARDALTAAGLTLGDRDPDATLITGPVGGLPEHYSARWHLTRDGFELDMFPAETSPTDRTQLTAQFDALCTAFDEHLTRVNYPDASPGDLAARWHHGDCTIDLDSRWSQPVIGVLQLHVAPRAGEQRT